MTLLVFLFVAALLAIGLMAYLALMLNELQKRVFTFCQLFKDRYHPGFFRDLQAHAQETIERLTSNEK